MRVAVAGRGMKAITRGALRLLVALACGCTGAPDERPIPSEPDASADGDAQNVDAAPPAVLELDSLDFDAPTDDLAGFDVMIEGSEVVSLGETIHYSAGYARARARLIRHLVEHEGFRAVAFEGSWSTGLHTQAYVEEGVGTSVMALSGLTFGAWFNPPTLELLEWLAAYNEEHPDDRVHIWGFDVQNQPGDGAFLREHVAPLAIGGASAIVAALDVCLGARFDSLRDAVADAEDGPLLRLEATMSEARFDACNAAIDRASAWLEAHRLEVEAAAGALEAGYAAVALRSLRAANGEYFHFADYRRSSEARDAGMADVFFAMRALIAPEAKTVVFAHNDHNRRHGDEIRGQGGFKSYGSWLAERLGDRYVPIGFFAHQVDWHWPNAVGEGSWTATDEHSLEQVLDGVGDLLLVDLGRDDVLVPGETYFMGHSNDRRAEPLRHYGVAFFMRHSEAADPFWQP